MLTSADILAGFRARVAAVTGKTSQYAACQILGCQNVVIYTWLKGGTIAAKYAIIMAEYCEIDAKYLVHCLEAERAQDPITAAFWEAMAADYEPDKDALKRFANGMPAQPGISNLSTGYTQDAPQSAAA